MNVRDNTVIFVRLVYLQTDTEFYTALQLYLFLDLFLIIIFSLLNKRLKFLCSSFWLYQGHGDYLVLDWSYKWITEDGLSGREKMKRKGGNRVTLLGYPNENDKRRRGYRWRDRSIGRNREQDTDDSSILHLKVVYLADSVFFFVGFPFTLEISHFYFRLQCSISASLWSPACVFTWLSFAMLRKVLNSPILMERTECWTSTSVTIRKHWRGTTCCVSSITNPSLPTRVCRSASRWRSWCWR